MEKSCIVALLLEYHAPEFLLPALNVDEDITCKDYKKFHTDIRISSVDEVNDPK